MNNAMRKNKKGSVFLIGFFVAIILVIAFMISLQGKEQNLDVRRASQAESPLDFAEILKRFTFVTASESLTNSTYVVGEELAFYNLIENSRATPYELPFLNGMIAEHAKQIINQYLSLIDGKEMGDTKAEHISNVDTVIVNVDDLDLIEENVFDNFGADFIGDDKNVVVSMLTGEKSEFVHEHSISTQCDRFYYVITKMNEWAITNRISPMICAQMPDVVSKGTGELYYPTLSEEKVKHVVEESLKDLQARFDGFVECSYVINNHFIKSEPIKVEGSKDGPCPVGDGVSTCGGGCPFEKVYRTEKKPCKDSSNGVEYAGVDWKPGGASLRVNCGSLGIYYEFMVNVTVSCTDKKCMNPVSSEGMKSLVVKSSVFINQTHRAEPDKIKCKGLESCTVVGVDIGGVDTVPIGGTTDPDHERPNNDKPNDPPAPDPKSP